MLRASTHEDEADLARLGAIVRALSDDDLMADEPPPHVWEAIAARTGIAAAGPDRPATDGPPSSPRSPGRRRPPAPTTPGVRSSGLPGPVETRRCGRFPALPTSPAPSDDAPGTGPAAAGPPGRGRWRVRPPRPWCWSWSAWSSPATGAATTRQWWPALALEPLPDEPTGSATPVEARVVETADGRRLDLSLPDGLPAPAGFYEVWLIDPDVEGMVSLGPARSDGTYAVPSDLDVTAFPIVDVSVEPPDGNPTHSGVSVLRGTLS